jgi:hypothetical protein
VLSRLNDDSWLALAFGRGDFREPTLQHEFADSYLILRGALRGLLRAAYLAA